MNWHAKYVNETDKKSDIFKISLRRTKQQQQKKKCCQNHWFSSTKPFQYYDRKTKQNLFVMAFFYIVHLLSTLSLFFYSNWTLLNSKTFENDVDCISLSFITKKYQPIMSSWFRSVSFAINISHTARSRRVCYVRHTVS